MNHEYLCDFFLVIWYDEKCNLWEFAVEHRTYCKYIGTNKNFVINEIESRISNSIIIQYDLSDLIGLDQTYTVLGLPYLLNYEKFSRNISTNQ